MTSLGRPAWVHISDIAQGNQCQAILDLPGGLRRGPRIPGMRFNANRTTTQAIHIVVWPPRD